MVENELQRAANDRTALMQAEINMYMFGECAIGTSLALSAFSCPFQTSQDADPAIASFVFLGRSAQRQMAKSLSRRYRIEQSEFPTLEPFRREAIDIRDALVRSPVGATLPFAWLGCLSDFRCVTFLDPCSLS